MATRRTSVEKRQSLRVARWFLCDARNEAGRDRRRELLPGGDAELAVHVAKVVLDRLRAQKERRRRLAGGTPFREQDGDLELLWREVIEGARIAAAGGLAGGRELGTGQLGPGRWAEAVEELERRTQLFAGPDALAGTAEARSVGEARARS